MVCGLITGSEDVWHCCASDVKCEDSEFPKAPHKQEKRPHVFPAIKIFRCLQLLSDTNYGRITPLARNRRALRKPCPVGIRSDADVHLAFLFPRVTRAVFSVHRRRYVSGFSVDFHTWFVVRLGCQAG